MNELTLPKIIEAFLILSISDRDYLTHQELSNAMNKLNAQPFDQETFQQLWEQCKLNSKGQAKLSEFVSYIIKAEEILGDKLTHAEIKISKHDMGKRPKTNDYAEVQQFKAQMQQLVAEKDSIKLSLKIIRKPFLNSKRSIINKDQPSDIASAIPTPKSKRSHATPSFVEDENKEQYLFEYDSSQTVQTLTKILYWTIALLVFTCFCIYLFTLFVDMMLCGIVLLGYCLQTINRKVIKLNLYLIACSIVYTFVWLVLYTDKLWYPAKSVEYPSKMGTYINLCIMVLIGGQGIKLLLCYYYLTIVQIEEEQVFSIELGSHTLFLKRDGNVSSAQKNALVYVLRDMFNKPVVEQCRPQLIL